MPGPIFLRKYRTIRQLDEGGMCKIFLARPVGEPNEVVVKVLREEILDNTKAREHFRREIFIMSRFAHPHAVAYIDSGPNEKPSPVLVMEYVRGTDLANVLARAQYFSAGRAGRILAQLCDVLGAAHAQGIVHRDLKPGNIMLLHPGTPEEAVKLMDFGLAKMDSMLYLDAEAMFDWSVPAASGTPEYIAPEQVRSSDVDSRADIYSLGVLLFEMLTGYRPFDSPDLDALLRAHMTQPPPTFRSLGVGDPKTLGVELVVRRCLGKTPEGRFQNTTALVEAYERSLGTRLRPAEHRRGNGLPPGGGTTGPPHLGSSPTERPFMRAADRHAIRHRVETKIPESMALLKIKGFIQDIGGDLVESVPGLIRFRLGIPTKQEGWSLSGAKTVARGPADTDVELRMEKAEPGQAGQLAVTLVMKPLKGLITPEWRERCTRIGRDLRAYLGGM